MAGRLKEADSGNCQPTERSFCVRNYRNYIKKTEESKAAKILIVIVVGMLMALAAVTVIEAVSGPEPDITYPMTNRNITWTGAGYGG